MTIQEAIKSGKPFKRKVHFFWLHVSKSGYSVLMSDGCDFMINVLDILATDWEVKP